ncbi:DUF3791 domain-containing protein [Clostridium disporicum]|uniref:DUF3791 domain-containing protein n=1 Tax=Clostridium disporicum TaxID=84024 RepID=UPI0034A5A6D3
MEKIEIEFAVFCIENIAERLNMNGKEVYDLLAVKSDLLFSYIIGCFEPLHTQGKEYIVNDIVELMQKRGLIGEV